MSLFVDDAERKAYEAHLDEAFAFAVEWSKGRTDDPTGTVENAVFAATRSPLHYWRGQAVKEPPSPAQYAKLDSLCREHDLNFEQLLLNALGKTGVSALIDQVLRDKAAAGPRAAAPATKPAAASSAPSRSSAAAAPKGVVAACSVCEVTDLRAGVASNYTQEAIIAYSQEHYGRVLCIPHQREERQRITGRAY